MHIYSHEMLASQDISDLLVHRAKQEHRSMKSGDLYRVKHKTQNPGRQFGTHFSLRCNAGRGKARGKWEEGIPLGRGLL